MDTNVQDDAGNRSPEKARRKKRGPYKSYLYQLEKKIPRNTLKSWKQGIGNCTLSEFMLIPAFATSVFDLPTQAQPNAEQNPLVTNHGGAQLCNNQLNVDAEADCLIANEFDDARHVEPSTSQQASSLDLSERLDTYSDLETVVGESESSQHDSSQEFEMDDCDSARSDHCDFQNSIRDEGENLERVDDASTESGPEEEEDNLNGGNIVNYIQKYCLNDRLHPDSPLSKLEVLLMILHLAIRHCNTQSFVEHQIKLINTLFGRNVLDISYHVFQNVFPSSSSIQYHYFCDACEIYLGSGKDFSEDLKFTLCPKCQKNIKIHSVDSENYFITLSIQEQVEALLRRSETKLLPRHEQSADKIFDIFDGELYKKYFQPGSPLSNQDALTCIVNTDGVRVFKNSQQGSLWPVFLHINELAPEVRFKAENLILAGLWFSKGSPNMALYLKPVIKELLHLSQNGVSVPLPDGSFKKRPLFAIAMSVDSVAKAKVVCQHQFNGSFSCLYCYHPNDAVSNESCVTQKHFDTSVSYPQRTEHEVMNDMLQADSLERLGQLKKSHVRGFLGLSVLLMFYELVQSFGQNPFHIVWSTVIDYMHALLEGVCSDLMNLYLGILSPQQIETVNRRLGQITLPHGMSRKPRPVGGKVKYKAKEYRSFFLYFALPCFEDLLSDRHFSNLKYFVNSFHSLLGDNISIGALNKVRRDLNDFVTGFQSIYGLHKVTYNLHLCTHLVDQVLQAGPLWCYSNFIFESGNGHLVKLVKGTRSVINEISRKYTQLQKAFLCVDQNPVSNETLQFCSDIVGCKYTKGEKFNDVSVTKSHSYITVTNDEKILFAQHDVPLQNEKVKVFNRIVKNGTLYVSKCYTKAKATNDSCAQLNDGSYVTLDKIVLAAGNTLKCLVKPIRIAEEGHLSDSIKKCPYYVHGAPYIVKVSEISRKCVFINFDMKSFVCCIPNHYERD